MKQYKGYEPTVSMGSSEPLPAGIYIARILAAKEEPWKNKNGTSIVFSFDVSEGEYTGFFAQQYKDDARENKKWKGNLRVTVPDESNKWFETQRDTFNKTIGAIEFSNAGYKFDWGPVERGDWSQLKGKTVGVAFRNKEYEIEKKHGWTTEAAWFLDAEYARSGKAKTPKDKTLDGGTTASGIPDADNSSSADDWPF